MCISEKIKRDQALYQDHIKAEYLKNVKAAKHYNLSVLKRFFNEWRRTARSEAIKKNIEIESSQTKNRMQKFLEAAASGQLQLNIKANEEEKLKSESNKTSRSSARPSSRSRPSTASVSGATSHRPPVKQRLNPLNRSRSFENEVPESERPKSGKSDVATDDAHLGKKVKEMMWPWVKTPFIINNYDNRFKAQEKLMHEQQKMMKGTWNFQVFIGVLGLKARLSSFSKNNKSSLRISSTSRVRWRSRNSSTCSKKSRLSR